MLFLLQKTETSICVAVLSLFMFHGSEGINLINHVHKDLQLTINDADIMDSSVNNNPEQSVTRVKDLSTEDRICSLLTLLRDAKLKNVRGDFFVYLLEKLTIKKDISGNKCLSVGKTIFLDSDIGANSKIKTS